MQQKSLRNILTVNKVFFILFTVFFLIGFIIYLVIDKGDAVLFFYHRRTDGLDFFFTKMTRLGEPKFITGVILLLLLFKSVRSFLAMLVSGLVTLVLAFGLKEYFDYTRPYVYFQKLGVVEHLEYFEGITPNEFYSFPSGHTYAAFAVFTLLTLVLKRKKWLSVLFFVLALLVGISRIYLFEHYLRDVLAGGFLGVSTSLLVYYIFYRKYNPVARKGVDNSLFRLIVKRK